MSQLIVIAAALTAALATGTLVTGALIVYSNRRVSVSTRLQRWGTTTKQAEAEAGAEKPRVDLTAVSQFMVAQINRAVARQSFAERIAQRLARADLKITVGEFLIINASAILIGGVVGWLLFGGSPVHVVVGIALGAIGPHWYVRMKQRARFKKFQNQLGDTISMLANSLRSGYSMLQSMDLVSREMPSPIADEFQRVTREVGLGLTPEEALANMTRRINSMDLELMVTAINVQREVGGNLSEILDIIANTIRERVKLQGQIKTLTAQQTMAGYIITGLPLVLGFFLYTIDPKYEGTFFRFSGPDTWQPWGISMAVGSLVLMAVGYVVMRKIVAIEV